MPLCEPLGRAELWLPGRSLMVGRLELEPGRPCVPAVGLVLLFGLTVVALALPVPLDAPPEKLLEFAVGRL